MSYPDGADLAAAAAGEHARASEHAVQCSACAMLLSEQTAVRALGRSLPVPRLSPLRRAKLAINYDPVEEIRALAQQLETPQLDPKRRAQLAAETLARADAVPPRRVPWLVIGPVLAAAAAIALVVATRTPALVAVQLPDRAWIDAHRPVVRPTRVIARAPMVVDDAHAPAPAPSPRVTARAPLIAQASISGKADYSRPAGDKDRVVLRDGTIAIDARDRAPVAIAIGDTTFKVADARVVITAAHGVIVSAHAFAGSMERTGPESTTIISAGEIWTPPAADLALRAFRTGWKALHEGHDAEALAAFSRASDPVIAEEASFWAAVASQRLGDREAAVARFKAFLDAYPQSTRAEAARAALDKL